jgi:hypothetical protein
MVVLEAIDAGVTVFAQAAVSAWNATVMSALVYNCAINK